MCITFSEERRTRLAQVPDLRQGSLGLKCCVDDIFYFTSRHILCENLRRIRGKAQPLDAIGHSSEAKPQVFMTQNLMVFLSHRLLRPDEVLGFSILMHETFLPGAHYVNLGVKAPCFNLRLMTENFSKNHLNAKQGKLSLELMTGPHQGTELFCHIICEEVREELSIHKLCGLEHDVG